MSSSKRLSLEERLALAAKKGKKKGKKQLSASPAPVEIQVAQKVEEVAKVDDNTDVDKDAEQNEPVNDAPEVTENVVDVPKSSSSSMLPEVSEESVPTKPGETVSEETKPDRSQLDEENTTEQQDDISPTPQTGHTPQENTDRPIVVKTEPQPLLKLSNLSQEWLPDDYLTIPVNKLLNLLDSHVNSLLDAVKSDNERARGDIKKKDELIQKLRKENETLSKKEELITQLRKEGEALSKTDLKKSNQIKLLKSKVFDLEKNLSHIHEEYTEVCDNSTILESNVKELQQVIASSDALIKEQESKLTDVEALRNEIKTKDEDIEHLKKDLSEEKTSLKVSTEKYESEMIELKETTSNQINSLETDIEQLKIELENAEHLHGHKGSDSLQSSDGNNQLSILEQQLKSSKENWASIEESLNAKIVHLDETIQADKTRIQAAEAKTAAFQSENMVLRDRLKETDLQNSKIGDELEKIKATLSSTQQSYEEIKDDYKLLERKYNVQKQQLTKSYSSVSSRDNSPDPHLLSVNDKTQSLGQVSEEWLLPADDSVSLHSVSTNIAVDKLEDMEVETPSRDFDTSLDIPEDAEHLQSLLNKASNSRSSMLLGVTTPMKRSDSSLLQANMTTFDRSNNTELQTSTITTNPQLVTRLGSEVRRLENELRNMQTSFNNLLAEKDSANEEILKLMENNDKVVRISNENKNLKSEVDKLSGRLEVSLQILGEKTETVEELQNDVNDLKDMIKQQVQQMVEMQESR